MDIHERLRYIRGRLGLTTRAFGKSINLTGSSITNMETGHRNITERTVYDICRVHDVNPEWLIYGKGAVFQDPFEELNVNGDVKELTRQYAALSQEDKDLIKGIMNALAEKTRLQKVMTETEQGTPNAAI